jgi:LuxR family maltose regulon positive regulatory protein
MKANLLKRIRIDTLLERFSEFPLTIVEAPMGYGKTTAVRQYLKSCHQQAVWLSFHVDSRLIGNNWERFAREVKKLDPETGEALQSLGFPADVPQIEQVLRVLSDFASTMRRVIVLDDYYLLNSPQLNRLLERLVLEQIENLHILLITRNTIGFNAEMLIAKGLCLRLDQEDLRLTKDEIRSYCQLFVSDMEPAELQKIGQYGEGWIALSYMLLLGFRQGIPVGLNLSLDALIEQTLFINVSPEGQHFLLELAVMPHFSARQAAFVTGVDDAAVRLRAMRRENAFIGYDERSRRYTIHAVLRDFLISRQTFTDSEKKSRERRLGQWFLREKDFQEAYRHFFLADEPLLILEHMNQPAHIDDQIGRFEGFFTLFKETELALLFDYPMACLQFILISLLNGDPALAELACQRLDQLEAHYQNYPAIEQSLRKRILAEILILRKITRFNQIEESTTENDRILALLDGRQSRLILRGNEFTYGSPSLSYLYFRESGHFYQTARLMGKKFPVYAQYADGCGTGADYLALAEYHLEVGNWDKADLYAQKTIYKAATRQQEGLIIAAKFVHLRLKTKDGRIHDALADFNQLEKSIRALNNPRYNTTSDLCRGYFFALLGQPEKIPYWLQVGDMEASQLFNQGMSFSYVVYGKAVAAAADYVRLAVLTETFSQQFEVYQNQLGFIHNDLFKSLAAYHLEGLTAGAEALEKALDRARPDGIILPFMENAADLIELLAEIAQRQPEDAFVRRIIVESRDYLSKQQTQQMPKLILTNREKEVLRLLAEDFTRDDIATRLFITRATVKTHLQNIYKKLGVSSKQAAINTAKKNGLLIR